MRALYLLVCLLAIGANHLDAALSSDSRLEASVYFAVVHLLCFLVRLLLLRRAVFLTLLNCVFFGVFRDVTAERPRGPGPRRRS